MCHFNNFLVRTTWHGLDLNDSNRYNDPLDKVHVEGNLDMFGINSDRTVRVLTLLGVARHDGSITIYGFSLFLTFLYVSNFSAIGGF